MKQILIRTVIAAALALLALIGTLFGLSGYLKAYTQPSQNWLPQGSFRAGLPGWKTVSGSPAAGFERSEAHVPLCFLHLEPGESVSTELTLEPGWRLLHVAVWTRGEGPGTLTLTPDDGDPTVIRFSTSTPDWELREMVAPRESRVHKLLVTIGAQGKLDLVELSVVPCYVRAADRNHPAH